MNFLNVIILGIVEGLTEFLPISSTGHLIVVMRYLRIQNDQPPWPAFLYFIQSGAILAVLIYFFKPIIRQIKSPSTPQNHLITKLFVGVSPAILVGLLLNDLAEKYWEWEVPVAIALILGAGLMMFIEKKFRRQDGPTIDQVTLKQAFLVGLAQCVAIIPGTSRSMASIMGGYLVGLPATTAAQFSFYLAIPTLLGASLLRIYKHWQTLAEERAVLLVLGFIVAFGVAWMTVAAFMKYIQTHSLIPFAFYRVGLGIAILLVWQSGFR